MEIERKFLMSELPPRFDSYPHYSIEQGYISSTPVIRIRKKSTDVETKYILTIKSSGLMSREEYEINISKEEYINLSKKVEGNFIKKTRYNIPIDYRYGSGKKDLTLELDVFDGVFSGIVLGEIEFASEELAYAYSPDQYFYKDVTEDTDFHNSTMSSMDKSEIQKLIVKATGY